MPALAPLDPAPETLPQVHAQISDHAVLVYLAEVYGLDVAAVRAEMQASLQPAVDFGAPVVLVHGLRLVLKGGLYCTDVRPRRRGRG